MDLKFIRRPFRYASFNALYWLIGINLLVFALPFFLGRNFWELFVVLLSMNPALVIEHKFIWTFVTYMFMHADLTHILFNMFGLFVFGMHLERQMGSKEFLLYYFVTGTLAGIFSFVIYYLTNNFEVFLMGASGALFAVMLAYAIFFPTSIIYIFAVIPVRAPLMVLGYTVISIFFILTGRGGNIAHSTHLAGFIFGWIYFTVRFGVNPWRRLTGR
ncbi:MAG: rhomboid family intramembrane serine protease [Treponema sp.]|nr:rhomboid family intramembrane serine protease [Treponema sp.]